VIASTIAVIQKNSNNAVWEACIANSRAYKKPHVSYLLEAFGFDQQRLLPTLGYR
jgi:hypothetical protein